jgi:acyl-coenzyme A thioesterase PaaI-like protein
MKNDKHRKCFGCGDENPTGLGLNFAYLEDKVRAEFIASEDHQGFPGRVHGGIISAILDEAMGYAAGRAAGRPAFTVELTVRFKAAAPLGEKLIVEATAFRKGSRLLLASGQLQRATDGQVIATAVGKFLK